MHFLPPFIIFFGLVSPALQAASVEKLCPDMMAEEAHAERVNELIREFGERHQVRVTPGLFRSAAVAMSPEMIADYLDTIAPHTIEMIHAPNALKGMGHIVIRVGLEMYNIVPPSIDENGIAHGPKLLCGGDVRTTLTSPDQGIAGHLAFAYLFPATPLQRERTRRYFGGLPDRYYHLLRHNCATVSFKALRAAGFIDPNDPLFIQPLIAEPWLASGFAYLAGSPVLRPIYNTDSPDTYLSIFVNKVRHRTPLYLNLLRQLPRLLRGSSPI